MTREELAKAIDEMIATDGPFLLEACVEEEGNVMPMTPPGGSVNQMLLECCSHAKLKNLLYLWIKNYIQSLFIRKTLPVC